MLEQAPMLEDLGAGMQLAPDATHVLQRAGAYDALRPYAVFPTDLTFRRWSDGTVIARRKLGADLERVLCAPYVQVHRADLHAALAGALPDCCTVELAAQVTGVEQDATRPPRSAQTVGK